MATQYQIQRIQGQNLSFAQIHAEIDRCATCYSTSSNTILTHQVTPTGNSDSHMLIQTFLKSDLRYSIAS